MNFPDDFYVHTAMVETVTGSGGFGDVYSSPVPVKCLIDESNKLVTNGNAEQVVSTSTLLTFLSNAGLFAPDSRVSFDGTTARVISVKRLNSGGMLTVDHVEVNLG